MLVPCVTFRQKKTDKKGRIKQKEKENRGDKRYSCQELEYNMLQSDGDCRNQTLKVEIRKCGNVTTWKLVDVGKDGIKIKTKTPARILENIFYKWMYKFLEVLTTYGKATKTKMNLRKKLT